MLSDTVWRGLFHRHIMTIGGRTATPARTAQPDGEFRFPTMPATHTPKTQTVAETALIDTNGMLEEVRAVAERRCSRVHSGHGVPTC